MRQLAAVVCACAFAGVGSAQFGGSGGSAGQAPLAMPGRVVGSSFNLPAAGTPIQKAAPPAGMPVGGPMTRPYDPSRPLDAFKGTNIDTRTIVAPVQGFPGTQNPNVLERLYDKLASVTPFAKPGTTTGPTGTYTPGISRRNRERAESRMWRRD